MKQIHSIIFASVILTFIVLLYTPNVSADSSEVIISPINDEISLQKTIAIMHIPEDKSLLWGKVKGDASDFVERYPVIIQFFKGDEPVHVAQVKVKGDGSYEYKFKIRNTDQNTGEIVDIFEGKYTVKIFKVIHTKSQI
ncbi:MAG: hypothetical protein RI100_05650 [Nitrosarchaeum sp.]|uniref:hypothetical protein n=1 Tax=Nitrosarchaeum sp. TaxID=2026886 RepID=UPI002DEEEC0E|nr:hypothetical protein [Nitrosarchaeum sp.]